MNRIDKEQVRRRFAKYLAAYDSLAVVQQRIAANLAGLFSEYAPARLGRVLEVGCGTGFLTRKLLKTNSIDKLYLNDLVPEALPLLCERLLQEGCGAELTALPGDAERISLPEGIDLAASASVVQWFEDPHGFFTRTASLLRPGGWFAFNLFGPENLHQIRTLTGFGLEYLPEEELRRSLERVFDIAELRRETIRQRFDAPFDVLRHLQQTGVTATGSFRWTPGSLRTFEREYARRYASDSGVFLDWDVIYVVAQKPLKVEKQNNV